MEKMSAPTTRMVEDALRELVPEIDETIARRLASNFASSKEFKALDASDDLKGHIKETAKKYIVRVKQQRMRHANALLSLHDQSPTKRQKQQVNRRKKYHVLIHVVGEVKFNEILSVYKEIEEIRKQSMIWTKFTPQFITTYQSTSTTAATVSSTSSSSSRSYNNKSSTKESSYTSSSSSGAGYNDSVNEKEKSSSLDSGEEDEPTPTPVSKVLPPPISNIYFHVRLVDIMRAIDAGSCCRLCKPIEVEELSTTKEEQQPMRNRCIVYQNDWDELLHDAKKKLAAFHKFQKENV